MLTHYGGETEELLSGIHSDQTKRKKVMAVLRRRPAIVLDGISSLPPPGSSNSLKL